MQSRAGRIIIRTFTVIFAIIIILGAFIFRAYNYGFNYKKGKDIPDKVTIQDDGNNYDTIKAVGRGLYDKDGNRFNIQGVNFGNWLIQEGWMTVMSMGPLLDEEGTYLGFGLTLYQISSQYYKIVCTDVNEFDNFANYGDKYVDVYFAISLLGKGKDLVITLNEEIYK